ncbi:zinc ribbon domain-containing protein [Thalassobacillus hwangdonensis]|uniref:Zinc ribbon domain-containing protein n=1 Tax=Thalassobacillus hwangdonensis TaxID=546108 RepID=A0ABW3L2I2_9BACI
MNYCNNCGEKLMEGNSFCLSCGQRVKPSRTNQTSPPAGNFPAKKMSKKKKVGLGIALIAMLLLVTGYIVISDYYSATNLVERYKDAVKEKDANALADLFVFDGEEAAINEQDAAAYLSLIDRYPENHEEVLDELEAQLDTVKSKEDEMWDALLGEDDFFIEIVEQDRFLLFKQSFLSIEPIYLTFYTDYKGTEVLYADKEIFTSDEDAQSYEYGPLIPGIYAFTARYKTGEADLTTTNETELWRKTDYEMGFNLDAEMVTFETVTPQPQQANLFINDKKTEINPFEEAYGPVVLDGSTTAVVEAEFPWGTMVSEPIPLTDPSMNVEFVFSSEMEAAFAQLIADFNYSYLEAYKNQGSGTLENAVPELEEELLGWFTQDIKEGYTYRLQFLSMEMQKGVTLESNGAYAAKVLVKEESISEIFETEVGPEEEPVEPIALYYKIIYHEGGWLVGDLQFVAYNEENFTDTMPILSETEVAEFSVPKEEPEASETADEESEASESVSDSAPQDTVVAFRIAYENALNTVDFSVAEDYLDFDSHAYHELKKYIETDVIDAFNFNFTLNEPLDVEMTSDGARVWMREQFIFTHDGERTDYDREKLYHLRLDDAGNYKIWKIDILDTVRD